VAFVYVELEFRIERLELRKNVGGAAPVRDGGRLNGKTKDRI
jgi:hypothetical protein